MHLVKPEYRALVAALRAERERQGLTQRELEERLGVADGQVTKWEIGYRNVTPPMLIWWVEALGLRLALARAEAATSSAPAEPLALAGGCSLPPRKQRAMESC